MKQVTARLLDFLYPAYCHLCSTQLSQGRNLCDTCLQQLAPITDPICSQCGENFDGQIDSSFICPNCHNLDLSFEFARAAYQANDNSRRLVHDFKYNRQIHLASDLAQLTQHALEDRRFQPYLEKGLLVPVPLHWQRLRKRRFNQSEEITKHLARQLKLPWANVLQRHRKTETQTRFSRKKRLENLRGVFHARRKHHTTITNKKILLIDDVLTTGSTADECAKTLLENGAQHVAVLTLLRG